MFNKKTYAIIAPKNSDIPDINVYQIAFFMLFVEKYIGTDILIPSGILWRAIAIANDIPSSTFSLVVRKVAIPSGILCNIIAIIENIPTLYNLLLSLFSNPGMYLFIAYEIIIPNTTNIVKIIIAGITLKVSQRPLSDEGSKSNKLTAIITPDAKLSDLLIIEFLLLCLKNSINDPNIVEIPAKKLIKNGNIISPK